MRRHRPVEAVEFTPPDVGAVVEWMAVLSSAGDGWVNLLPGVPEDAVEEPPRTVFTAIFGSARPPVTMCTWMPARHGQPPTVGVSHPGDGRAVPQLVAAGIPLPHGWRLRQDHVRRGLVAETAPDADPAGVLDWLLRAGELLARVPLTGTWQARVHLPT